MTNFSKCKNPAKIENPKPTGNSVSGTMKPVKVKEAASMKLSKTGDHSANQGGK